MENKDSVINHENEINIEKIFKVLASHKWFIFSFTSFFTMLVFAYDSIPQKPLPHQYLATIYITQPTPNLVISLNKKDFMDEDSESVFIHFLNVITSKEFQKKILNESNYLNSISINNQEFKIKQELYEDFRNPIYKFSLIGGDPKANEDYLRKLISEANNQSIDNFITLQKQIINNHLYQLHSERNMALSSHKYITSQKIKDLTSQIYAARAKAKQDRLNKITVLTEYADLAEKMGIKVNNFKGFSLGILDEYIENVLETYSENFTSESKEILPYWYLYGELALRETIQLLKNRTSDDPFIKELSFLNNELLAIELNKDSYSPIVYELDFKIQSLELFLKESINISTMSVHQQLESRIIPNAPTTRYTFSAFIASFILSIFISLLGFLEGFKNYFISSKD